LALVGHDADLRLGLRADRVFEVTILDDDALDPPPAVGGAWSGHCIAGIGRRNGRFVTVLDLERLLGSFEDASRAA
jgi:purine-binding chemotaxis protein CheW